MTNKGLRNVARLALWALPIVLVIAGAIAASPWLKRQNSALASVLVLAEVMFVTGYGYFLANRLKRRLDEVQIASQGFANYHGAAAGTMAAALLLILPPVMNWLTHLTITISNGSPDVPNRGAVQLAFFGGLCLVVLMQSLGQIVATIVWWRRMGGIGERS